MMSAVVLAGGASSRMGARNKLLIADGLGRAMVGRVVSACRESGLGEIVVVTGHQAALVEAAVVPDGRVRFVHASAHADGMSASLRAGIGALGADVAAAVVCLADMPLVTAAVIDALIAAHTPGSIVVPVHAGRRGNPVLWDRRFFAAITALRGDTGARALLGVYAEAVLEVAAETNGVLVDFDTPESLLL